MWVASQLAPQAEPVVVVAERAVAPLARRPVAVDLPQLVLVRLELLPLSVLLPARLLREAQLLRPVLLALLFKRRWCWWRQRQCCSTNRSQPQWQGFYRFR